MISYLDAAKSLTDTGIYTRGLKLYLEGMVVKNKDLELDFWREYEIKSKRENYIVKIPLLHLALSRSKFEKADIALNQVVNCDCQYFLEFGVCKHIVAVCASLEDEFKIRNTKEKKVEKISVIDNIFEAESEKKLRIFVNNLEYCLSKDVSPEQLGEYLGSGLRENIDTFLSAVEQTIDSKIGDYTVEKRLVRIATNGYLSREGGKVWQDFWFDRSEKLDKSNQINFFVASWENYLSGQIISQDYLKQSLPLLPNKLKKEILQKLRANFPETKKNWIDFIFIAQYKDWLDNNYRELESEYLIQACNLLPDRRDEFENILLENLRVWSDFLPVGEYKEVFELFNFWQDQIGRSEQFEEGLKYFKEHHKRRPKLLDMLSSF